MEQNTDKAINWIRTGPSGAETVVLIHPVGHDLSHWSEQIDALRLDYDVIAFDLPGHGLSSGGAAECTFETMVATIRELIDRAGRKAVHVAGISVGGMIAQHFALTHPDATLSLTLIATASSFPEPVRNGMRLRARTVGEGGMAAILDEALQRWFAPAMMAERPHVIDRVSKTMLAGSATVHAAMWNMIAAFDVQRQLGMIACPTLVIAGDLDPSTPPAVARAIAEGIANARLVVVPGASHMITLERPDAVNDELRLFLQSQKRVAP